MPRSRNRSKRRRDRQQARRDPAWTLGIWDLHLPVIAVKRGADGSVHSPRPIVYGTAFPIAEGLFVTAGHVVRDAQSDGELALSVVVPGQGLRPFRAGLIEMFDPLDLALITCKRLAHLPALRPEFDRPLGLLAPVSAVGFPLSIDAEYVSVTPRAFGGFVVARRDLRQLPSQPTGYEVSFFAPQGLSGAPLVSTAHGAPRCYGYMIQQGTLGLGEDVTPVGIAVGIEVLLTIQYDGLPLAPVFGRDPVVARAPVAPSLPGGLPLAIDAGVDGWPDDAPAPVSTDAETSE